MQKLSPLNLIKIGLFGLLFAVSATSALSDNHPFIEVTFNDQNPPTRERTEQVWTGTTTLPRIDATFRFTDTSLYWWQVHYFIDGVEIGEATFPGGGVATTPYGSWRDFPSAHSNKCGSGAHYQCNGVHFQPNSQAITSLPLGQELKINLLVRQWGPPRVETNTIIKYVREDVSIKWSAGSSGMETNRSENFDSFNWHYGDITANFDRESDLRFHLRIKDGTLAEQVFIMGKGERYSPWSGFEWYSEGKYGKWYIRGFSDCGNRKCSRVLFQPNRTQFNRVYGKNIRMRITVTRTLGNRSQVATLEFNLTGRAQANLAWNTEGAGNLKTGNLTNYGNIVGNGTVFKHWQRAISFQATEKVNVQATEVIGNRTNTIESNKRQFGSNLTYGSWWVDEQRSNRSTDPINNDYFSAERGFFFEPDSDAIVNNLEIGQTVTSTLKFRFHAGNDVSTAVDKTDAITVTITRLPVVTITVDNTTIKEGGSFTYTLTADPAPTPTNQLSVLIEETEVVRYTDGSNIRNVRNPTKILTRETFLTTKTTEQRDTVFPNGTYIVRVKSDENYVIKDGGIVTIAVENVAPSEISISTDTTSITEGESFEVTLTASPVPLAKLSVILSADDSESGFFDSFSASPVEIPTTGSAQVTISTNSLATRDMTQALEISIDTASSYVVSSTASSITVNVEDNNMHTISITSPEHDDTIVEGAGFSFTLTATPPPTANLRVTLNVETTPTGYLGDNFRPTVVIDSTGVFRLTVATDQLQRFDKVVRVVIGIADKPTLYVTSSEESSITVSVAKLGESELSRVSITSNADGVSVIEGQPFTLSLIAEPAPVSALEVMLMVPTSNLFDHASINLHHDSSIRDS